MKRWTASFPSFNLIHWKKTVPLPEPGWGLALRCLVVDQGTMAAMPLPWEARNRGAAAASGREQPHGLYQGNTRTHVQGYGVNRGIALRRPCHTAHSNPCNSIQMAGEVWGYSCSAKVANLFINYSLLAPKVCNMLYRLYSQQHPTVDSGTSPQFCVMDFNCDMSAWISQSSPRSICSLTKDTRVCLLALSSPSHQHDNMKHLGTVLTRALLQRPTVVFSKAQGNFETRFKKKHFQSWVGVGWWHLAQSLYFFFKLTFAGLGLV